MLYQIVTYIGTKLGAKEDYEYVLIGFTLVGSFISVFLIILY